MDEFDRTVQRLKIENDFRCEHKFHPILCKHCGYFYVLDYPRGVARCLKQQIREWVNYHISQ